MASPKTMEETFQRVPLGPGSPRKVAGFWQIPKMIDRAYDYSKRKHGKVTKEIIISDHGSGMYHGIEKIYGKYNNYLSQRGEKVNMAKSGSIIRKKPRIKMAFNPATGKEEEADYKEGREYWSFEDACEGYKLLRLDSKDLISEARYRDYYGSWALKPVLRRGSYLKFREFNEKSLLEQRILR